MFLGHGAERTGPPILLGHLIDGLACTGSYRASVVVARDGPLVERYRASGAAVEVLSSRREPWEPAAAALRRLGAAQVIPPVQRSLRRHTVRRLSAPDLIYVNAATPPTVALLRAAKVSPDVPVLLHVHELDIGLRLNLAPPDLAFLLDRADHVITVSPAVKRVLVDGHGVPAARITTCAGFIDPASVQPLPIGQARSVLGIPNGARVVGSVGVPDWRKAPEHLLHAVLHARSEWPDLDPWVVWIGGDPASDDGRRLADEARRVGLAHRLVHRAHVDRPDQLLSALDVFALPAREDALPLAALEAASAGLALVCFRTGGIADLADSGAGAAVDYPDVAAFGRALAELLVDDGLRRRAGERAADLVHHNHDLDVGVARIRAVIDYYLGAHP